jgi:hypothetical protein
VHQDLDAGLPNVVAAAELIVGTQHCLDIRQNIALGQERLDGLGEIGRAAQSAADHDFEAGFTPRVAMQPQCHIVDAQRRTIAARRAERNLELARHERKFGM